MATAFLTFVLLALPGTTAGLDTVGQGAGTKHVGKSFLRTLHIKHKLRICNAYPHSEAVDVSLGGVWLTSHPIPYRACREIYSSVKAGDKLQFRIGGVSAGSFMVSELPGSDAVLMLLIYRHSTQGTEVAFESHVFANLVNAQIAVLDTYRGPKKASLQVQDGQSAPTARREELRFDSVVAVNPGVYEVILSSEDGDSITNHSLVALNRESYVVVRCGLEGDDEGQDYPQELMVYPESDPKVLTGAASMCRGFGAAALLLATLALSQAA